MEVLAESDVEVDSHDSYLGSDHFFSSDHDSDPEIGFEDLTRSNSCDETP